VSFLRVNGVAQLRSWNFEIRGMRCQGTGWQDEQNKGYDEKQLPYFISLPLS